MQIKDLLWIYRYARITSARRQFIESGKNYSDLRKIDLVVTQGNVIRSCFYNVFLTVSQKKENKLSESFAIGRETCILSDSTPDDYLDKKNHYCLKKTINK